MIVRPSTIFCQQKYVVQMIWIHNVVSDHGINHCIYKYNVTDNDITKNLHMYHESNFGPYNYNQYLRSIFILNLPKFIVAIKIIL